MKEPRRRIEREFGVPFAGEILDPARWTQTALKHLPADERLSWPGLFGRQAPVVLDLGCGNGRFLIGSAVWRPGHDHLGVDVLPLVIRYATRRANQRGIANLRFAVAGARELLDRWVEPGSVTEIHCYHPQPYHDPSKGHLRLLTPEFLALVHRSLRPDGRFFFQTDHVGYWRYVRQVAPSFFEVHEQPGRWPDAPKGRTRREIIDLRRGMEVFRGWATPLPGLSEPDVLRRARGLPLPAFDLDPRLRDLDRLESGAE